MKKARAEHILNFLILLTSFSFAKGMEENKKPNKGLAFQKKTLLPEDMMGPGFETGESNISTRYLKTNKTEERAINFNFFLSERTAVSTLIGIVEECINLVNNILLYERAIFDSFKFVQIQEKSLSYSVKFHDKDAHLDFITSDLIKAYPNLIAKDSDISNICIQKSAKVRFDKEKKEATIKGFKFKFRNKNTGKKATYLYYYNVPEIFSETAPIFSSKDIPEAIL